MTPIPLWSFGGYRRFCRSWWKELWRFVRKGWWQDLCTYWHRARYGWAPRDTWGLDDYLAGVLGGSLHHLADHHCGTPACYPQVNPTADDHLRTNHNQWTDDLHRWAHVFGQYADRHDLWGNDLPGEQILAEERRRMDAVQPALAELTPWFSGLWD